MDPSDVEISERAYAKWAGRGQPHGTPVGDWLEAEAELRQGGELVRQLAGVPSPGCQQLLHAILDHCAAAIYVKDTRGRYLFVNRRFEALLGGPWEGVTGMTDYDLYPREKADALRANDLRVLTTGQPMEFEEVLPQDDGDHTYTSLKFPVRGSAGRPYAVCGISTDVTARKRAERYLMLQYGVTWGLAGSAGLADAGPKVLRTVCESFGWDVGLLWSVDPSAGVLRCAEVWHSAAVGIPEFEGQSRRLALPPGVGLPGRVWATGQLVWVSNVAAEAGFPRSDAALRERLCGACGFPVRNGGEVLGVFEFVSREVREPDAGLARVMGGVGSQLSQFIERRHAERAWHERQREFDLARQIQEGLLPRSAPATAAGFAIAGASRPAQETGGDYLDFFPMPGGAVGIAVGDASGHGIAAALVMAETRAYLRARAVTDADVGAILGLVNRQLAADLPDDHFVTLLLARLDPAGGGLTYASAGHWPGYVLDDRGEVRAVLGSTGFPVGVDPSADFPTAPRVALRPGDLILLLTDGIPEACSPDGPAFGAARALEVVRGCRGSAPAEIVATLLREVHAFSGDSQADDITAVVVKIGPGT